MSSRHKKPLKQSVKNRVWKRSCGKCEICGFKLTRFRQYAFSLTEDRRLGHVDHIVPVACGGSHDLSNLRLVCEQFNTSRQHREDSAGWCHGDLRP